MHQRVRFQPFCVNISLNYVDLLLVIITYFIHTVLSAVGPYATTHCLPLMPD